MYVSVGVGVQECVCVCVGVSESVPPLRLAHIVTRFEKVIVLVYNSRVNTIITALVYLIFFSPVRSLLCVRTLLP